MENILYHYLRQSDYYNSASIRISYMNYLNSLFDEMNKISIEKIFCIIVNDGNSDLKDKRITNQKYGFDQPFLENSGYLKYRFKVFFIDLQIKSETQFKNKINELISKKLKTKNVYFIYNYNAGNVSDEGIKIIKHKGCNYIIDDLKLEKSILGSDTPYLNILPINIYDSLIILVDEFEKSNEFLNDLYNNLKLPDVSNNFKKIYSWDNKMLSIIAYAEHLSTFENPILITGETGTGKELFAKAIYSSSKRSKAKYHPINTAAYSDELFGAEIFGTEKGGFTGAIERVGYFEQANGGTVFLDEIGDLSLCNQVKLLRILQEKKFKKVGGTKEIDSDFRLICATNKDLAKMVKENTFREDLYYRLKTFVIHLPPLRERGDKDISELLLKILSDKVEKNEQFKNIWFSDSSLEMLCDYEWPGNVRELENFIINAIARVTIRVKRVSGLFRNMQSNRGGIEMLKKLYCIDEIIVNECLDLSSKNDKVLSVDIEKENNINDFQQNQESKKIDLKHKLEMIEKDEIIKALNIVQNQDKAGIIIGYNQKKMSRLIKKYNIKY